MTHQVPLLEGVAGNRIFPLLRWVGADPDGVYLLDFSVVRLGEDGPILGRQHPPTVVNGPFHQGIPGVVLALGFDVDDEADCSVLAWRHSGKPHIIDHTLFCGGAALGGHALNLRRVRLIRVDAHLAHLWVVLDIAYDLRNGTVLVFRYTGLHNVRQHFFIGQHILKHCILAGTSVHPANASGHLRFHGHLPPFHGNILHSYYTCFWLPCQGVCSRFRHKVDTQERIHPV